LGSIKGQGGKGSLQCSHRTKKPPKREKKFLKRRLANSVVKGGVPTVGHSVKEASKLFNVGKIGGDYGIIRGGGKKENVHVSRPSWKNEKKEVDEERTNLAKEPYTLNVEKTLQLNCEEKRGSQLPSGGQRDVGALFNATNASMEKEKGG